MTAVGGSDSPYYACIKEYNYKYANTLTVNPIYNGNTIITGKSLPNAMIRVKDGDGNIMESSAKTDENGNFSFQADRTLLSGMMFTVESEDINIEKVSQMVIVNEIPAPSINYIKTNSTSISGNVDLVPEGELHISIFDQNNNLLIPDLKVNVNSDGSWLFNDLPSELGSLQKGYKIEAVQKIGEFESNITTRIVGGVAPEINSPGFTHIFSTNEFEEYSIRAGVNVIDLEDGDISPELKTYVNDQEVSEIDISIPGVYKVLYSVQDSDGNTVTKDRIILVDNGDYAVFEENNEIIQASNFSVPLSELENSDFKELANARGYSTLDGSELFVDLVSFKPDSVGIYPITFEISHANDITRVNNVVTEKTVYVSVYDDSESDDPSVVPENPLPEEDSIDNSESSNDAIASISENNPRRESLFENSGMKTEYYFIISIIIVGSSIYILKK